MKKSRYHLFVFLLSIGIFYSAEISGESVAYHFNAIKGTEEFGVMHGLVNGPQEEASEKVICKESVPFMIKEKPILKMQPKLSDRKKQLLAFMIALKWGIAANNTCVPESLVSVVRRP